MMGPTRAVRGTAQPHHQRDNRNEDSRTGNQNSGHGGHK